MSNVKKTKEAIESGRRIQVAREHHRLTLAALSNVTGGKLTASRIGNYEQGTRKLTVPAARVLGAALNAHPAYLMGLLTDEEDRFLRALNAPSGPGRPSNLVPFPAATPKKRTSRPSPD